METHAFSEGTAVAIKILIIVFLVVILYSLASALVFLVKDHGEGDRTVKRLTWRIGLSLVLFLFLWFAYQMGWVEPHQGPVGMQMQEQPQAPENGQ
jgi:H+/Cl- antiporter ClcA